MLNFRILIGSCRFKCFINFQPSRELAEQTFNQIVKFKKHLDNPEVRELLVIGGVNVKDQIGALNAGVSYNINTL